MSSFEPSFERNSTIPPESDMTPGPISNRVREVVERHLGTGVVSMAWTAQCLSIGVSTLRRRLGREGLTYEELVDDVRRRLAERYLDEPSMSIDQISSLLGFAHKGAFYRVFRRWRGMPPAAYRTERLTLAASNDGAAAASS